MGPAMRRGAALAAVLAVGLPLALLAGANPARAQTVELTTPFPAVDVEAGRSVTLDITVHSPARQRVDLEVVQAPQGWTATFRGGGFVVHGVTADPDDPPRVTLDVDVPADAGRGPHTVVVQGTGSDGSTDRLAVDLVVADKVAGAVTLEGEFPRLRGGVDDTYRFSLTLRNETPRETTFALSASGPEGWQVQARPAAERQATTITVGGGGTASVDVEVTPASDATAGEYPIEVRAAGGGEEVATTLTVEIVGSYDLSLTTPSQQLNASGTAGEATQVQLLVENGGSAPLTDVSLSSSPPANWEVTFEPDSIPEIPPGAQQPVTATITPANEAVVGDYMVTLSASGAGRNASTDIRFTVETSTAWGVVGLLVIAGAGGGLYWVFRRYGRR